MTGKAQTAARSGTIPSSRMISILLVLVAIGISGYLAYTELTAGEVLCVESPGISCDIVQNSAYSEIAGIKVAYLGLLANLVLLALFVFEDRLPLLQQYGVTVLFGILLIATLYSVWLIYVQAALLKAFCPWCLAHEVVVFLLFGVACVRLARQFREED